MIVLEETRKQMKYDRDTIARYIKDHIKSSLGGGGYKWRDAYEVQPDEWKDILEQRFDNIEKQIKNPDWYIANRPSAGERARSEGLADLKGSYGPYTIEEARIILFGNHMSLDTVFIKDHVGWYSQVLTKCIDVIKPAGEISSPLLRQGLIYQDLSDQFNSGLPFHAYDAKKWDAAAGIVLGKYFHCLLTTIGGIPQVASGQTHTSMNDTIANIQAGASLTGLSIVIGDDRNHFGNAFLRDESLKWTQTIQSIIMHWA